jgi:hypothetical protein
MAKRILVPLDEAVPADSLIEAVGALARNAGATVRLLHVAPVAEGLFDERGRVLVYADQETARLEAAGLDYLHTASRESRSSAPCDTATRSSRSWTRPKPGTRT